MKLKLKLSISEQRNLRSFLFEVYGTTANGWLMNENVFDLTYQMLSESRKCSDLMDLVPRPLSSGKSASKWLSKEVRRLMLSKLKERKHHYSVCVKTTALKMKARFHLLASDL